MGKLVFVLVLVVEGVCFGEGITIQAGSLGLNDEWCPGVGKLFAEQSAAFTRANASVKVDLLGVEGLPRDRVEIEEVPVLARNVVGVDALSGYEIAWLASRGDIVPIDKFLPDEEFGKEDFYENLWGPVTFEGKLWGVPFVVAPLVFLYRPGVLSAAGWAKPPGTWEELGECAKGIVSAEGMPGGVSPLYVEDVEQLVLTVLLQKGDLMRDGEFNADVDELADAMRSAGPLESFMRNRYGRPDLGNTAMIVGHPGVLAEIPRGVQSKFRFGELPRCGRAVQVPHQMTYLAIRSAQPAYEAASWEFVKWMVRADAPFLETLTAMPCRRSAGERLKQAGESGIQDVEIFWNSLGEVRDYGPNNLFNRRGALDVLARGAGEFFGGGRGVSQETYAEVLAEANGMMKVIGGMKGAPYALYR